MTDSDTRSPLTAPLLRNPGQSLDAEIHGLIGEEAKTYHKPAKGKPEIGYDGARLMKHLDRAHRARLDQHLQLGNLHESFLLF